MKINWSVRLKNIVWLAEVAASVLLPILAYYGMSWEDVTSWGAMLDIGIKAVQNPVVVVAAVVGIFNAITDPTTAGLGDSCLAMTFDRPKEG